MIPRYLYHWTHYENLPSILRVGIRPDRATGKRKRVWACTFKRIHWANEHVCELHGWGPLELRLLIVRRAFEKWTPTAFQDVFTCDRVILPEQITSHVLDGFGKVTTSPMPVDL